MEKDKFPVEPGHTNADKKYVMVIDLARCNNARKCVEECQKAHHLPPDHELMKVYLMQESEDADPYWMPKPCFHCDNPSCAKECAAGATIKRADGIVYIDQELCIGCKSCVSACPYSSRQVNNLQIQGNPEGEIDQNSYHVNPPINIISKCDFCADRVNGGKLPYCVTACPSGVIYFGNQLVDSVSNGLENVSFKELINNRSGYHYREDQGTLPSVWYLPPTL